MITAGDERGRTQRGNNNAYCQDNEISWVDWRPDDAWLDVYEITKTALRLRREHPALRQRHYFDGPPDDRRRPEGPRLAAPRGPRDDRARTGTTTALRRVGMFVSGDPLRSPGPRGEQQRDASFLLWFNAGDEPVDGRAARQRLGPARRGRALHRPRPAARHARSTPASELTLGAAPSWCCARPARRSRRGADGRSHASSRRSAGRATTPSSAGEASEVVAAGTTRTV